MKSLSVMLALGLLLAGCSHSTPEAHYDAYGASPHYGSAAACPSSATSVEGGNPTRLDCVPGGTE